MTITFLAMLLIPLLLLVIVLGFITLNRYITYKERVALAQMGYPLRDLNQGGAGRGHGSRGVLWGGVITGMSGLALLLGLSTLGTGAWLLGGFIPLFVGLGMVLIYFANPGPAAEGQGGRPADEAPGAAPGGAARSTEDVGVAPAQDDAAGAAEGQAPATGAGPGAGDGD